MSEAITGLAAKFYGFASKRISLIKDFHDAVADEILGRISSGTVLDIGTGPGDLLEKVVLRNQHLRMVGLDISRDMIKIARKKTRQAGKENLELLVGDAAEIGIIDESVDLVVATLSFHHWKNQAKAFDELFRVLKPQGEVWIYELDSELTPQSEAWMKENYKPIMRAVVRHAIRIVSGHSITVEKAQEVLGDQKRRFAQVKVERLKPPLIKMTFAKNIHYAV
ncbi:MAG: class I SAM-dependent methyltransferase [Candidatus Bathyarchaeia archaeon]